MEVLMLCYSKPQEIAKRTAIFTAVGQAGSMFAGAMMTAVHKGMNGYAGLPGWKWVFLIGELRLCGPLSLFLIFGYHVDDVLWC